MTTEQQISKAAARMEWWLAKRDEAKKLYYTWRIAKLASMSIENVNVCKLYVSRYESIITFCHARYLTARNELKNLLNQC